MKIAKDILKAIKSKSLSEQSTLELIQLCEEIYDRNINVGHDQLVRSMLLISKFDKDRFLEIINSNFYGDPRDVLVEAHSKNESINFGLSIFPLHE